MTAADMADAMLHDAGSDYGRAIERGKQSAVDYRRQSDALNRTGDGRGAQRMFDTARMTAAAVELLEAEQRRKRREAE